MHFVAWALNTAAVLCLVLALAGTRLHHVALEAVGTNTQERTTKEDTGKGLWKLLTGCHSLCPSSKLGLLLQKWALDRALARHSALFPWTWRSALAST